MKNIHPEALNLVGNLFAEMNNQYNNELPVFINWKNVVESGTPLRALIHSKESRMKIISGIDEIDGLVFSHMLNDTIAVLYDPKVKI